jgi:plasmid stability protein
MHTLHVRSVPDSIYSQIRDLAQEQQRSLSAQVVVLLERALQVEVERRQTAQALTEIRRRRFTLPPDAPDSTELLREDRTR